VPKAITVNNGTQFDAETFKDFCDQIGMKIHFASVRHLESNGLVERANGIIMTGIMKLIFNQPRGKWPDELIKVVWSHNTTISRSTGFTPFKLLFGYCLGPSSSESPQKCNLTMSSKHGL
jgi:transposase InsO family protein